MKSPSSGLPLLLLGLSLSLQTTGPVLGQEARHIDAVFPPPVFADRSAWLGKAHELRQHIRISTGLWPEQDRTPARIVRSEPASHDGYSVEGVAIETLPGFYVTGNLYKPAEGEEPFPAVLSAHGHWQQGRLQDAELASVPGRAISLARLGFVVFTYSMIGYNETADFIPHRFSDPAFELWGFSAMGLQLRNSLAVLDFVHGLPEVDPARIGMTGASGGGTQTYLLTAVDERIAAAAPVNMISAHFQGGCVCENAPLLRVESNNVELGALAAPRPLLLVSTSGDWTADTPEIEFPAIQAIYRLFDQEERIRNDHFGYPHNYNKDSREAVYAWFSRWLLGRPGPIHETPFAVPPAAELLVELPDPPASLDSVFAQFRQRTVGQLDSFAPFTADRWLSFRNSFGLGLRTVLEAGAPPELPESGLTIPSQWTEAGAAVLVVHDGSEDQKAAAEQAGRRAIESGEAFMIVDLSSLPAPSAPNEIEFWSTYNRTTHSRQVAAVVEAAERLQRHPAVARLELRGLGSSGPVVLLARALLENVSMTHVDFGGRAFDADDDFLRMAQIPLLRRVGDFRTAAALIAPEPVHISGLASGTLRDWFEEVYRAVGDSKNLVLD